MWGVETGEHLAPGRPGGSLVPIGQPAEKPAIWRGRRQPVPVIAGEDLLQHDRKGPAVEHDVVVRQHEPVPIRRDADQRRPEGRRLSQVAHRDPFGGADPLDLLIDVDVGAGGFQVDSPRGATGSAEMTCPGSWTRSHPPVCSAVHNCWSCSSGYTSFPVRSMYRHGATGSAGMI